MAFFASKTLQKRIFDSVYSDVGRAREIGRSAVRRYYENRLLEIGIRGLKTAVMSSLDVGCGRGVFTGLLRPRFQRVIASDRSFTAVRTARRLVGDRNVRFAVSDAGGMPFRDGTFDCVTAKDILHHIDEPAKAVSEMERVLRAGGILISVEPNNRNWAGFAIGILLKHERKSVFQSPGFLMRQITGQGFSLLHYGMDGFFIPYGPLVRLPAGVLKFLGRFEDYMGKIFPVGGGHFVACYQKKKD